MKTMLSNPSDEEVIQGVRKNENWAMEKLYKLNRESFFNYVRINNGSIHEAKDILQDAIIVVHEKITENKLELTCSLKTYLTAVCNNLWYKKLRSKGKLVSMPDTFGFNIADLDSEEDETTEMQNKLMTHFKKLGLKCQELLTERFWKKKKMKVIAEEFGKNVESVKVESSRCIKRLHDMFNGKTEMI